MKRIAVLTSGGDAPGMNAAIRSVVRTGLDKGWEVFGVRQGYAGLIADNLMPLGARDVSNIIQSGGTILGSSRAPEFETAEGRWEAVRVLNRRQVEALIVIGGNGSQAGANALSELEFPVVGVASTIDNDLYGSEICIGVDTALNIALEAIDQLKVTASSHQRAFIVETMGRDFGYLGLMTGIAGGAEYVIIPEVETHPDTVAEEIRNAYRRGKALALVVVAEGAYWNAERLVNYFKEHDSLGFSVRATILGHVQRGGAPTYFDRLLATRLGASAVQEIGDIHYGVLVGLNGGQISSTPLAEVVKTKKTLDLRLLELSKILAK